MSVSETISQENIKKICSKAEEAIKDKIKPSMKKMADFQKD